MELTELDCKKWRHSFFFFWHLLTLKATKKCERPFLSVSVPVISTAPFGCGIGSGSAIARGRHGDHLEANAVLPEVHATTVSACHPHVALARRMWLSVFEPKPERLEWEARSKKKSSATEQHKEVRQGTSSINLCRCSRFQKDHSFEDIPQKSQCPISVELFLE